MCADLCFSLDSVRIQPVLIKQLTVALQVRPKVSRILPQLEQHKPPQIYRIYPVPFFFTQTELLHTGTNTKCNVDDAGAPGFLIVHRRL